MAGGRFYATRTAVGLAYFRFMWTFFRPGIYNAGAYKLRIIPPPNMIGRMKFAIEPAKGPGECAILAKVQPYAKHEYWKTMIERRLRELPE